MTLSSTLAQRSGIAPAQAEEVIRLLGLFGLVDPMTIQRAERDARIYELRKGMTAQDLAERFGVTERRVRQVIKAQLEICRIV
jgi:hypothetical protein